MKIKRKAKSLLRCAAWATGAFGAAQIYFVRELFFAWLMFVVVFCMTAMGFFFLTALFEATRAALDWVVPRISAVRPAGSARLARSH
jgi:hypothetical protein